MDKEKFNKFTAYNKNYIDETKNYESCDIFCLFQPNKLNENDYIKGMVINQYFGGIHIDPLVNATKNEDGMLDTESHNKDLILNYNAYQNGTSFEYKLTDIYIQKTSSIPGKNELEICLLFNTNEDFLVVRIPIDTESNTTSNMGAKIIFDKINKQINDTNSVENKIYINVPDWDPFNFIPANKSFFTWQDTDGVNKVNYIKFKTPLKMMLETGFKLLNDDEEKKSKDDESNEKNNKKINKLYVKVDNNPNETDNLLHIDKNIDEEEIAQPPSSWKWWYTPIIVIGVILLVIGLIYKIFRKKEEVNEKKIGVKEFYNKMNKIKNYKNA